MALAHARANPRLESDCESAASREPAFRGNFELAGAGLNRALEIARRAHDRQRAGVALRWLGTAYRLFGQHERALKALREGVVESSSASDRSTLAYVELNLGLPAHSMRDRAAATRYADHAAQAFDSGGDSEGRAAVRYLDGAIALGREESESARAAYRAGLVWADRSGDVNAAIEMHLGLSQAAVRDRRWKEAERELEAGTLGQRTGSAVRWAALAIARGDLAGAERLYREWLALLHPSQHDFRYEARSQLALVYLRRGDIRRSEAELSSASEELDGYRASLSDAELRLHAVETADHFGAPPDAAEWGIAGLAKEGRLASAFDLIERRRAQELLERLTRAVVFRGASQTVRLRRGGDVKGLDSLVAAIPDDRTAVLEHVASSHGAPTTLLAVTRAGARAYVLAPLDSLQEPIVALETLVESGASPRVLERRLGDALLAPALGGLPATIGRLLIIPDGVLHHVPFDALVMPDGRFVVERFAVGTAPSSAVATELWRRPGSASGARILALGDPRFANEDESSGDDPRQVAREAFAQGGGLPRLRESGREAREVARFAMRGERDPACRVP